jgi:hypothetical protein
MAMMPPIVRYRIEICSRATALASLSAFGRSVGPRIGPNKRSHDQKEDYCVRKMMLGLLSSEAAPIPNAIEMLEADLEGTWPDALLHWSDGSTSGLEITEATSQDYQRQLALEERIASREPERIIFFDANSDGCAGKPAHGIADQVSRAIELKGRARTIQGKYSGTPVCDLLIYENTGDGLFSDSRAKESVGEVLGALHFGGHCPDTKFIGSFRHVHLLIGEYFIYSMLQSPRIYPVGQLQEPSGAVQ